MQANAYFHTFTKPDERRIPCKTERPNLMTKATKQERGDADSRLPPYGCMNSTQAECETDPEYMIPMAFCIGDTAREKKWAAWVQSQAILLERCFGPIWGTQDWSRKWETFTRVDLNILSDLSTQKCWTQVISATPPVATTHSELFEDEDDGLSEKTVVKYCPAGSFRWNDLSVLVATKEKMVRDYVGTIHITLKRKFQRPRPHQAAAILLTEADAKKIHFEGARSAATPAFISGHAFENGLSYLGILRALTASGASAAALGACAHMITDVGDRRVFAGVHYPSDSLASWLLLANTLSHYPELCELTRLFATQLNESPVYVRILADKSRLYAPALAALHAALSPKKK